LGRECGIDEVVPHVAPIVSLVRAAAAADPEMETLLAEINAERLDRMHHNAQRLAERGPLREGMTVERARDIMYAYTASQWYEMLVVEQHWTVDDYGDFIFRGLVAELLES
jgi:hypothetical protein